MIDKINSIKNGALNSIEKAGSLDDLENLKIKYLGRKSEFTNILKSLKDLPEEQRRTVGQQSNATKKAIEDVFMQKEQELKAKSFDFAAEKIDVTMPAKKMRRGHLHMLTQVRNEIEDIFTSMGFETVEGPEIETEFYNFDALNMPKDHPARDMQDTFWLKTEKGKERLALRTQTSAAQVKYMEKHEPPLRIIVPGKCFRREATDSTHEHTFYQFEALMVGEDINVGNLKYIAQEFFSKFFKKDIKVRLRPSYFPFTEPSFEFDISCTVCGGKGCSACRNAGWLEIGGAGMVNQNVFIAAGYKRNAYQGLAWGFGLERLAMMKYKVTEIRLFHGSDLRFIKQF
ncbi:MAG TPA: phenylalanine--tRNA ligase subunit alpha [Candidatus Moranbacteria bacterium]|nr:phenylalanine--tRNA ligase subunit alpha [Candidatus Moranbacteria bacterium]HRY28325.1 phenylalanine--tRNA ligase subunit alpha [Candidatus Moranbacteria bacterium]HSA08664.1 phenylalanine--tRNA ligase subunit alpha [Candidatus Moranbacteria bacterium]